MKILQVKFFYILLIGLLGGQLNLHADEPTKIVVGIEPHAYFVERIAGDCVDIHTLIENGADPHAFQISARQMVFLGKASMYFQAGLPFEEHLQEKLKGHFEGQFVDLRNGIKLRHFECSRDHEHEHHHHHGAYDPHSWLDPINAQVQVEMIVKELSVLLPEKAEIFRQNADALIADLASLHDWLSERLKGFQNRKLMVFHPALGYFCDQYQLEQIAVEQDGKQPGGKYLSELLSMSKDETFQYLIVEPQSNRKLANVIVSELGLSAFVFNPLERNYLENLRALGEALSQ